MVDHIRCGDVRSGRLRIADVKLSLQRKHRKLIFRQLSLTSIRGFWERFDCAQAIAFAILIATFELGKSCLRQESSGFFNEATLGIVQMSANSVGISG